LVLVSPIANAIVLHPRFHDVDDRAVGRAGTVGLDADAAGALVIGGAAAAGSRVRVADRLLGEALVVGQAADAGRLAGIAARLARDPGAVVVDRAAGDA